MEIQMDEFLECQRIIEEQRRLLISNQDLRLKQGKINYNFCFAIKLAIFFLILKK